MNNKNCNSTNLDLLDLEIEELEWRIELASYGITRIKASNSVNSEVNLGESNSHAGGVNKPGSQFSPVVSRNVAIEKFEPSRITVQSLLDRSIGSQPGSN